MRIRFGFVAMSLQLFECSPSKTITATNFEKISDIEVKKYRLEKIAKENIANTLRIMRHAVAHDIWIYRLTSKLIPLATHPLASFWHWQRELAVPLAELGDYVKQHDLRVSAHPDHFTVLNSPKSQVLDAAIADLSYHNDIFTIMGLDNRAKLVLHIGGAYKNKKLSIDRFINNYYEIPKEICSRIILENDDKSYHALEVLEICEHLKIPMVLDLHHHMINPGNTDLSQLLERIFATWQGSGLNPKIHLSSPKSEKDLRSHADNVDPTYFLKFLPFAKEIGQDFDVMIEAKNKDVALFNLMEDLKKIPDIKTLSPAIISY